MPTKVRELVAVNRFRFLDLLDKRLKHRWLADRQIVLDAVTPFFSRHYKTRANVVARIVEDFQTGRLDARRELRRWLAYNQDIKRMFKSRDSVVKLSLDVVSQIENVDDYRWPVPPIDNVCQLASFLSLSSSQVIDWLTLPHRRRTTKVFHYRRTAIRKRDGSNRWLEQPAPTLKRIQRTIARELLTHIPIHDAAYGFRAGRNIVDGSRCHVGRQIVFRLDLKDFFPSISTARVRTLFSIAGYPPSVAKCLSQLCTAPAIQGADKESILGKSRLPQGAPTSPALSNALSFALDRRISALARSVDVTYTRYADDLIFSSDSLSLRHAKRFATTVAVIAMEEGFHVNYRKTKYMQRGNRQQVLGLTVNEKLNSSRKQYEILKATLCNCLRSGLESQNRDGHTDFRASLRGRISHVAQVSPARGERLMRLFCQLPPSRR